ncbi:HpcH/HpaI aldolase/citrate lyase family protein [Sphingomonas sp.]|uniref:HpcH/HpaI aldolase/citrate lyase family protein n=1 Tax=Sphingomonas sp. TaxID=28214 RepID=UPI003B009A84
MIAPVRPRRSMLYVPGDKPRALAKAMALPADGLILDLEDAVAPGNKHAARQAIVEAVADGGHGARELILRVSAADCAEDFVLAERLPLDGVLLPKVEDAGTVRGAAERTPHPIWCMIETPLGVLRAPEIAAASASLAGFVAGTNDLAKDLRARHVPDRAPLLTSLSLVLLAARAHGLAAIDGVHLDLDDAAGFEAACRQGLALGFDGKSLVHPGTIDAANRIFAPSPDEIARAREMVAAWEARPAGTGVARIGGTMVEQLHVDEAERLLAFAEMIEARG